MKRKKKTLSRDIYVFADCMIKLKHGTRFQKLFHKWYQTGSMDKIPRRVYNYLIRESSKYE